MNFESTPLRIAALFLYLSISFHLVPWAKVTCPWTWMMRTSSSRCRGSRQPCNRQVMAIIYNIIHINFFSKDKLYIYIYSNYIYILLYNYIILYKYHKYHSDGHVAVLIGSEAVGNLAKLSGITSSKVKAQPCSCCAVSDLVRFAAVSFRWT